MKLSGLLSAFLLLSGLAGIAQEEQNGTIYIKHPYINAVNKSSQAYVDKDWEGLKALYSDTAKWWISGLEKPIPIAEALAVWKTDFDVFDDIKQEKSPGSYPDYLHYKDQDGKSVQSWWVWSGKSKKTGEPLKVRFVQFDEFNNDGKITGEYLYGDFSKISAAKDK
jgi:hypothetical protein